jgi:hypothetical protein
VRAFGVGRGVDRAALLEIMSPGAPDAAAGRYLDVAVLDDAPW